MTKKLIFDLDGTLLFLSDEWEAAYQRFIDEYKLNITPKGLYESIGNFEQDNKNLIVSLKILCDYLSNKIGQTITEEMLKQLNDYYNNVPLLNTEKVYEVLSDLSSKYELIAYTNWFTKDQEYRLEKYDLKKFFKKVYGWDIIKTKPSIEGYETITKDNKDDYIMIGDNIKMDIEIPDSLGIKTIFYNRKNIIQDKYNEIENIEELKEIL